MSSSPTDDPGFVEMFVVDQDVGPLLGRASAEVDSLGFDVTPQAGMCWMGVRAVAVRHSSGRDVERNFQEHRQVPLVDDLIAMEEEPVDYYDRPGNSSAPWRVENRV